MRKLRQLSLAIVLTCMFTTHAFAGIIDTPPAPAPPSSIATGAIETPPSDAQPFAAPTAPVVGVGLDLIQTVLSLL